MSGYFAYDMLRHLLEFVGSVHSPNLDDYRILVDGYHNVNIDEGWDSTTEDGIYHRRLGESGDGEYAVLGVGFVGRLRKTVKFYITVREGSSGHVMYMIHRSDNAAVTHVNSVWGVAMELRRVFGV
jgi:hypothetical protein